MRASAPWGVLVALAAPAPTWALGLGDIELNSALNQPFTANIDLSATAEELETLRVGLADRATFERSGLDRPSFMSDFEFTISRNAAGEPVISVTSDRSVAEPFVTMIIEATWSTGTVQREYTVFLDPPVLLSTPAAPTRVAPAETGSSARSTVPAAPIERPAAEQPRPQPRPAAAPPAPAAAAAAADPAPRAPAPAPAPTAATDSDGTSYGPVERNQTLWEIAELYRPAGVSMNQMLLGLYEANPQAFAGNMNVLLVGSILRVPPESELQSVGVATANAEFGRQREEWLNNSGQSQRLVLRPAETESLALGGGAGGEASDQIVNDLQAEVEALRSDLEESQRLLAIRDEELRTLQEQLSATEAGADTAAALPEPEVSAGEPGVDLAPEQVFADEPQVETEPEPVAETPVPTVSPTTPQVVSTPPEPSLLARILGALASPMVLIGAGAAAVLLAGLWFMRRRREQEIDDVTGHWDALEAGMDEAKDLADTIEGDAFGALAEDEQAEADFIVEEEQAQKSTTLPIDDAEEIAADHYAQATTEPTDEAESDTSVGVVDLDEADPVAEADFHMAYGLYDQAADLLTKELRNSPDRRDLQLKLLEVYFVWGNKEEFLDAAQHLHSQIGDGGDADWDKVLIMGKQICPDAELFADAAAMGGGPVDVAFEEGQGPSLDFSFDDGTGEHPLDLDIGEAPEMDLAADGSGGVDLDLSRSTATAVDKTGTLDIGEATAASLEAALFEQTQTGVVEDIGDSDATELMPTQAFSGDDADVSEESGDTRSGTGVWSDLSIESPTVEQGGPEEGTMSTQEIELTQASQTAVIETDLDASGMNQRSSPASGAEYTAEIDVNDLGLDVDDVEALSNDMVDLGADLDTGAADEREGDTRQQPAVDADTDAELLSATGIAQVLQEEVGDLEGGRAASRPAPSGNGEAADLTATAVLEASGDFDVGDLSSALDASGTMTQLEAGDTPVDLDIGEALSEDGDSTGSEDMRGVEPQTMTEVGTKLDLARAYIDMGDPDGAKSILEEVLAEGDTGQREEAQGLMDAIGA